MFLSDIFKQARRQSSHKQTLTWRLLGICRQLNVRDPLALSRPLVLLINGAQATAGMLGKKTQMELIEAAEQLVSGAGVTRGKSHHAK
jgi:hypothetical protein